MESMRKKPLGLYVHIPFCIRKCAYCDFLSAPASGETMESYVNLLCREIEKEAVCYPDHRGRTVFFGGGTPTVLRPEQLERILCKLKECFAVALPEENTKEAEITLECNPGTVREEDLRKLRRMGFNRLSIGLQSARNEELRRLGRIHTWEEFLETYDFARKAGFKNINIDLMSALPGQSVGSYVNTLQMVTALSPEHISAYGLIIEEGTSFYERFGEADEQRRKYGEDREHLLPSEEEERRMYELTEEILMRNGYHRYEISNYALPGYECRHNITYWKRGDYLGIGLGASSLMENRRFAKTGILKEYEALLRDDGEGRNDQEIRESGKDLNGEAFCESGESGGVSAEKNAHCMMEKLRQDSRRLSAQEQMEEFMFLGLRLMEGISRREFWEYFQVPIEKVYGDILERSEMCGLLKQEGDRIFLTKRGIDVSNTVLAEFLL